MGGMPIFEFGNWLHQTTAFYTVAIPFFLYLNNFAGPRAMEPVFCRDYIMAQFDKMAQSGVATGVASQGASAAKGAVVATTTSGGFTPTPGKVPQLPKQLFAARGPRGIRLAGGMASLGLLSLMKPRGGRQ